MSETNIKYKPGDTVLVKAKVDYVCVNEECATYFLNLPFITPSNVDSRGVSAYAYESDIYSAYKEKTNE